MQIINKIISELIPYARNARTHSPEQLAKLAATISGIRWTNPVQFDDDGIIAGHGRVLVAERIYADGGVILGPDGEPVPVGTVPGIYMPGLTEAQRRALIIADNKHALDAGWDEELLRVELMELQELDFDLELTGFGVDELAALLAPLGIEHGGNDHSGASPWDRMNGAAKPGVLVTAGEVTCRISDDAYATLLRDRPKDNVAQWLEGIIYAACGRP